MMHGEPGRIPEGYKGTKRLGALGYQDDKPALALASSTDSVNEGHYILASVVTVVFIDNFT